MIHVLRRIIHESCRGRHKRRHSSETVSIWKSCSNGRLGLSLCRYMLSVYLSYEFSQWYQLLSMEQCVYNECMHWIGKIGIFTWTSALKICGTVAGYESVPFLYCRLNDGSFLLLLFIPEVGGDLVFRFGWLSPGCKALCPRSLNYSLNLLCSLIVFSRTEFSLFDLDCIIYLISYVKLGLLCWQSSAVLYLTATRRENKAEMQSSVITPIY
jgi:hypothetical protein